MQVDREFTLPQIRYDQPVKCDACIGVLGGLTSIIEAYSALNFTVDKLHEVATEKRAVVLTKC